MLHIHQLNTHKLNTQDRRLFLNSIIDEVMKNHLFDPHFCLWQRQQSQFIQEKGTHAPEDEDSIEKYLAQAVPDIDPHPLFDGRFYLDKYSDVAHGGTNPLVHYLLHGAKELRDPNRFFDTAYYVQNNPDCVNSELTPLGHYILKGSRDRKRPHPWFDSDYYNACYSDIGETIFEPFAHYLHIGASKKRRPSGEFDPLSYLRLYPDVAKSKLDPATHFVQYGRAEGRTLTEVSLIDGEEYEKLRKLEWQLLPLATSAKWTECRLPRRDAAGSTYLKIAKQIIRPFQTLIICDNLNNLSSPYVEQIKAQQDGPHLTLITGDSVESKTTEPRGIALKEIEPTLTESEIQWLLAKLITQTRPAKICDIESGFIGKLLKQFSRQIKLHSKIQLVITKIERDKEGVMLGKWINDFNASLDHLDEVAVPNPELASELVTHFALEEVNEKKFSWVSNGF